jgi:membrane protein YqaA with SNARE-associated domain
MRFLYRLIITIAVITLVVYALGALTNFDYSAALKEHGKLGMFLVTFISSSIFFVFSSEAVIVAATKFIPPWDIFIYATLGSTLGAVFNYLIGLRGLRHLVGTDSKDEKQAEKWFSRWGSSIVFFAASIPFVGDMLTVVAGMLEMNFPKFLVFSLAGRAVKMLLLIYFGGALLSLLGL